MRWHSLSPFLSRRPALSSASFPRTRFDLLRFALLLFGLLLPGHSLAAFGCIGNDGQPIPGCIDINSVGGFGGAAFKSKSFFWSGTLYPATGSCAAPVAKWGFAGPDNFGVTAEGDTVGVTFGRGGVYQARVDLTSTCGCTSCFSAAYCAEFPGASCTQARGTGFADIYVYEIPNITGLHTNPDPVLVDKPAEIAALADYPASGVTADYDFDDGKTCTGCEIYETHTYELPGEYDVKVTLHNPAGSATKTFKLRVHPDPPEVYWDFDFSARKAGTPIKFNATIGGGEPGRSILWDFGDGTTSTEEDPTHTFEASDLHLVTLSVTNRWGTETRSEEIYIEPKAGGGAPPSSARFTFDPLLPVTGQTVRFTDTSTGTIKRWRWAFDYVVGQDLNEGEGSYERNPTHVFTQWGRKNVGLWVSNEYGTVGVILFVDVLKSGEKPLANFTWSPFTPRVHQTIQFTDASAGGTSWHWDFGDGTSSTAQHPTHAYASSGQKAVTLTVTNAWGTDSITKFFPCELPDGGPALEADFSWSPTNPRPGDEVAFSDSSTGSPDSWSWIFSDGFTSNVRNPRHAFATTGSYSVKLTVGKNGQSHATTKSVVVENNARPSANFSWSPASPKPNEPVSFTNLSTGDPTNFEWSFGDGSSSQARHPQHTFSKEGPFTVKLTVSNAAGSDILSRIIEVSSEAKKPEAKFQWSPNVGSVGTPVTFVDTSTGPPESWNWNFGDGTSSTAQNPSHTFTAEGTYPVTLTVTNAKGSDNLTQSVAVGPSNKPVADFTFSPPSPKTLEAVVFTSTSSGSPTSLEWSFGDGGSGSGTLVTHIYTEPGLRTVTLTAKNANGSDTKIRTIGVGVPPVLAADFTTTVADVLVKQPVQFTDRSTGDPDAWLWNFGDGHTSTDQHPTHTFIREGIPEVTLTATKAGGTPTTKSVRLPVYAPPQAKFSTSGDLAVGVPVRFTDQSKGPARGWQWTSGGKVLSREPTFEHTFDSMGNTRVELQVLNPAGSDQVTREVAIGARLGDQKPVINDVTGLYGPCFYAGGAFKMDVPYNLTIDWKSLQTGTVALDVNGTAGGVFDVSGILNPDRVTLDTSKLLTDPDKVRENTISFRAKAKEGAESYPQSIFALTYPTPTYAGVFGNEFKRVIEPNRVAFLTGVLLPVEPLDKVITVPSWVPALGGHPLGIKETQFKFEQSFRTDCTTLTNIEVSGGIAIAGGAGGIKGGSTKELTLSKSTGLEEQSQYEITLAGFAKAEREYGLIAAIPVMTAPCGVKYLKPICDLIKVKLSVTGELGGAWELDLSPKAPSLIKKGTGTFKLQVMAGGEIEKLGGKLTLNGGGTGAVKLGPWTQDPWLQKFEGSIDYSVVVIFKVFTTEYKHSLACTYEPVPGWSCGANVQSGRGPVSQAIQGLRPVEAMSRVEPVETASDEAPVVLRNVSPLAEPAAAARGNRALMVYLGENESMGSSAQRLDVRYTTASGTPLQWSEAKSLTNDRHADFNPAVVWASEIAAVAAWERVANADLTFDDVTKIEDVAKLSRELDIAAATYDAASDRWSPVTMLTANEQFDSSPTLAALSDSRVLLVWLRQAADLSGPQHLVARVLANGSWSPEEIIANDLQGIDRIALVTRDTRATLVVSRDRDGNTDTSDDGDLALFEYNGTSWSTRRDVTTDPENDTLPSLTWDAEGARVYWNRNGKLATRLLPDGAIEHIQPDDSADPTSTLVTSRPDGSVVLTWSTGTTLYGRVRDRISKRWSSAISLAERPGPALSLTAFAAPDGLLHLAGTETQLTYEDVVRVIDGKPVTIVDVPTPARVDLVDHAISLTVDITADKLRPEQPSYTKGDTVVFTADVTNAGNLAVTDVPVVMRAGTSDVASTTLANEWLPGETRTISLSFPWDGASRTFSLVLDPAATLNDAQPANNTITWRFDNLAPRSCLQATVAKGATPLSVTFDSSCSGDADGTIVSRTWIFGDATSADGLKATHQYSEPGSYNATLLVTDNDGRTSDTSIQIDVASGKDRRSPDGPHSLYVPIVGRVGGLAGSFFVTDMTLRNTHSDKALEVDAVYLPDGKPEFHKRITLQGGETLRSSDIIARLFGASDGTGSLRLDLSHPHAVLVTRTYNQQPDGTAGFSSNAVPNAQALYDGERGTVLQHWLTGYRTNVGFTEIGGAASEITANAYAENGSLLGTETFPLGPYEHVQHNARPLFQNRGRIEFIVRGGAVIPYVTTLDGKTSDPILQSVERPKSGATESALLVPIVGRLRGANNSAWRSDVRVFNPAAEARSVSAELRTAGGNHTATFTLAPGQTASYDDVISSLFPQLSGDVGGALLFSAPGPLLVTSRTFNLSSKGTYGLYGPARAREELLATGSTAQLLQIQENTAYRTNLGLTAFDGPAAVRVRALDARGNQLAIKHYGVGAGLNAQIGFVLADMKVADPSSVTALEVTATEGTVFVYATVIDNQTGDATFVESIP